MAERGLRVLEADKTFFGKITNTITKLLIPTRVGINGLLILTKRNNVLKAYENYTDENNNDETNKKEILLKKYEDMYALYLESIDKYVMDSIYKKVKNNTASDFERNALSQYYNVVHLKETQYIEYKYRKQKYLLELDYESVLSQNKEKMLKRYQKFYSDKMESLYKAILKNYSIQLADNMGGTEKKDKIYENIFATLEEYICNILPIKLQVDEEKSYKEILKEYDKFNTFLAGKLDERDIIEKKAVLLGISRKLFTHSLPLIVAEQCYIKLLKDIRNLIINAKNDKKKNNAYEMLLNLIEDYNIKLLSTKIYWDKPQKREEYKKFWEEYNKIQKLESSDHGEYLKQKEILFIKNDLKALNEKQEKYVEIIKFHKGKLVELGEMRNIRNAYKTLNKTYTKKKLVIA
ncbi:MAG: hypothetical protein HFJ57_02580 [Clostridia bacterium]|nr:hypothetical protein [Clostridia bacterium]